MKYLLNTSENLISELRKKLIYLLMPPTSDPKHINLIGTANVDDPACGFGLWIITDSLLLTWSSSYSTKSLSTRIKWSRLSDLKSKLETFFSDFFLTFFQKTIFRKLKLPIRVFVSWVLRCCMVWAPSDRRCEKPSLSIDWHSSDH